MRAEALKGGEFQFKSGWSPVVGAELMGRGQIMQGLEGHAKALRFYSHCDVGPWKGLSRGMTHLMF